MWQTTPPPPGPPNNLRRWLRKLDHLDPSATHECFLDIGVYVGGAGLRFPAVKGEAPKPEALLSGVFSENRLFSMKKLCEACRTMLDVFFSWFFVLS